MMGFLAVILTGALLLMMPFSTVSRTVTPFIDCLFTAISSTCVTGLVVYDTATHWSIFGQAVILVMIQIGGMGVITMAILISLIAGKKISLKERSTMQESVSAPSVGGVVRFSRLIIITALIIEGLGAIILSTVFCRDFGLKGIWMSIFHSVSAFCNAGFDLLGSRGKFSSLTTYSDNIVVNVTIMLLIIIGGIGFMTWDDVKKHKWHISRYKMQSKIILILSAILILIPALYFFFFEFLEFDMKKRILASLFQSVTTRTAGFNTVEASVLSESGNAITTILMLIGGAPGSTAGGMKVTTLAVLLATAASVFKKRDNAHILKRSIANDVIKSAVTVLLLYIISFLLGAIIISRVEGLPLTYCLYETASAIGTVGLTVGITSGLGTVSKIILMLLMYAGRVGGLTIMFATVSGINKNFVKYPIDKISVG